MADEITVDARLRVSATGYPTTDCREQALSIDMAGVHKDHHVQEIGFAAHEAITVSGDIGTPGMAFFKNLDTTNFVQIGVLDDAAFAPLAKLLAGEPAQFRLATGTFYAQADTAAVNLDVCILEA